MAVLGTYGIIRRRLRDGVRFRASRCAVGEVGPELAQIAGIDLQDLPIIVDPEAAVGPITEQGSSRFGVPAGTMFVSGSGDGFLANVGSGCTSSRRMAVTLGTSGVARQMLPRPSLNADAGTFCYRAREDAFLLGCASSNGGNVLDWARKTFGPMSSNVTKDIDLPVFLPFMNGERSLEWNPNLRETWHGRLDVHTPAQLSRAVTEGVLFNIAQYVEVVERESGAAAEQIYPVGQRIPGAVACRVAGFAVGKGIGHAGVLGGTHDVLRGAAIYAWRALGHDAAPALESEIEGSARVPSKPDPSLMDRFARFKELRRLQKGKP